MRRINSVGAIQLVVVYPLSSRIFYLRREQQSSQAWCFWSLPCLFPLVYGTGNVLQNNPSYRFDYAIRKEYMARFFTLAIYCWRAAWLLG
jgi:hypothetical protein